MTASNGATPGCLRVTPTLTAGVQTHRLEATCRHGSSTHTAFGSRALILQTASTLWGIHQRQLHCHCALIDVLILDEPTS